jgi:hypothetical protein
VSHVAVVVFLLSAALTAAFIAHSKRHSAALWFVLGGVFPLLAIIAVMLLPARAQRKDARQA